MLFCRSLPLLLLSGFLVSCLGKMNSPAKRRASQSRVSTSICVGEMINLAGSIDPRAPRLPLLYVPPRTEVEFNTPYYVTYKTPTPGEPSTQWWNSSLTDDENYKRLDEMSNDDKEVIFDAYVRGASTGHGASMINLGHFYLTGTGTPKKIERALFWYGKVAKSADPLSSSGIYNIRFTLLNEIPWEDSLKEISEVDSQTASTYEYGELLYQLDKKAKTDEQHRNVFRQLEKFAKEDSKGSSHYVIALCYREGLMGVGKNEKIALTYYRNAAEKGYKNAQLALGNIYLFGLLKQAKDISQALSWYRKAIVPEQNRNRKAVNYRALAALAVYGAMTPNNGVTDKEIKDFFNIAAEEGKDPFALYNRGVYQMEKDKGILTLEALKMLRQSLGSNQKEIDYFLVFYFAVDFTSPGNSGSEEQKLAAIKLLQEISSKIPCAKTMLANCYMTGNSVEKDAIKAARLYEENRNNDPCALYNLGLCLEAGAGVLPDPEKGKKLKQEAEKKDPVLKK